MENFEAQCPDFMKRILKASKNLDREDMKLIAKFMMKQVQEFKTTARYEFKLDPNYNKVIAKLDDLDRKGKDTTKVMQEYEAIQEKMHKPLFDKIEKFIKQLLVPQHVALLKESIVLKYAIFDSLLNVISPYAKKASYTINDKDLKKRIGTRDPFSLGAQKEMIITKTLNDDGTYNTSFSDGTSPTAVVYDSNGRPVAKADTSQLATVADELYKRGFNVDFFERNWSAKDCKGKTPASSVETLVMRTRVDKPGKENEQKLQDYMKVLGLPPAAASI